MTQNDPQGLKPQHNQSKNSVDPDQTAPSGAVWSGYALFAYAILSNTFVYKLLGHLPWVELTY